MNRLSNFLFDDNVANYVKIVQVGFSQQQAKAMSWIAEQKPKGKFIGLITGLFLAASWGHWHDRFMSYFRFNWNKRFSQFFFVATAIAYGDYWYSGHRKGADQLITNILYVNNNLFVKNIQSLVENFNVLNRKFTEDEIKVFNDRAFSVRSNVDLKDRKWIYNPNIYTIEQFERRVKLNTESPWKDNHILNTIKYQNIDRKTKQLILEPVRLNQIIDMKGDKIGVANDIETYWRPLQ